MEQPTEVKKSKKIEDYEVDNACDALLRAEDIKKNEPLMKLVHKKLMGKKAAIETLSDLRKVAEEKLDEEEMSEEETD